MVQLREDWAPDGHVALLRVKNTVIRGKAVAHCTASAVEIRAAVGTIVAQRTDRNRLLQWTALSKAPCSVYSTDSKPLPFAAPVVLGQNSLEDGVEMCCIF
ncbi:hypothetical protein TNCV_4751821 [Trichonephila clavipes]|nr:hypothetical protein TNCV_4751821 [Trichonephila clavipes]